MSKVIAAAVAAAVAALLAMRGQAQHAPIGALAVLSTHVSYEASLIDATLPRLPAPEATVARTVRDTMAAQAGRLSALLTRQGYPPARAQAVWAQLIGDGVPPPSRALQYVCSVHVNGDRAQLAAAPEGAVGSTLGAIELTLLVEGQALSRQLGGALGATSASSQQTALHRLAPLLVPSDRLYALSA